ncbi:MAG: AAA family ATPase [Betaproteobacteria bacterium]|nr:AAA family ATPase [Betaproteobacteria bacterium]
MYLDHFGLREAPFRITPHTEFFFAGGNRGSTLDALIYAITHDEGIVKVSGEVGSGKTMLCRMLLERLPDNVETVYLANPSLSRDEILFAIADELGVPLPESKPRLLLRALQERLIEIYGAGKQVVVLIDEAHAMPAETLEEIRLLSNLESNRHKLLQIVLFGQPELDARLAQTDMRQLKERITHNFALEPLKRNDISSYLMFRMRAAGYHGPDLFSQAAIQLISRSSEGLTRRINILADKALLAAFSQGTHQVDHKEAKAAIRDAQFNPMADGRARPAIWIGVAALLLTVAGAGILLLTKSGTGQPPSLTAPPTPATPVAAPTSAPTALPAIEASPPPASTTSTAPAAAPTDRPAARSGNFAGLGPLTAERLQASEVWLRKTPGHHYFIQLLNIEASAAHEVEAFLATHSNSLDSQQLRVYRSSLSGQDRIGVIYGDFATRNEAIEAIGTLPAALRMTQPHPRAVARLR